MQNKEELLYQDKKLATTTYKCPCCGGEATFSPKDQKLKCDYCGALTDVDFSSKVSEKSLDDLFKNAVVDKDVDVYQCSSCGAKELISKQDIAMSCPFCGTNNIVKMEELSGIKPQGIVPFKIEKEKVTEIARKWAKKKWLAPNDFSKIATAEHIKGLYNPLFTFDCETESKYKGRLGESYTVTRNGKTHTEVRYFSISGSYDEKFDDVLVQASDKISQKRLDEIAPFSTNDAVTYDSKFLRGYTASSNTKDGKESWEIAKGIMKELIEDGILDNYSYDFVDYLKVNTEYSNESYKYVLVPLYVGVHKYKNKIYNFYVNGLSGRITGDSPISVWKSILIAIISLLIVGLIVYFSIN